MRASDVYHSANKPGAPPARPFDTSLTWELLCINVLVAAFLAAVAVLLVEVAGENCPGCR